MRTEFLAACLRSAAGFEYSRHPVPIVAITGSAGKTTTKECVAAVLASTYTVRSTVGNRNDRTGVPSTLLGLSNLTSLKKFLGATPSLLSRLVRGQPEADYLVLEIAARLPNQIPKQLRVFSPSISIVTSIGPAHLATLGAIENVAKEKGSIVAALPHDGYAILFQDDENVRNMAKLHSGQTLFFGFSSSADVWMDSPRRSGSGLTTVLHDPHGAMEMSFPHLMNRHHLNAVLAAWCVGLIADVPRGVMASIVQDYAPKNGRGTVWTNGNNELFYDDTFNANPLSMRAALETFREIAGDRRRILVLGDMLELGEGSDELHESVGRAAAEVGDVLITAGEYGGSYVKGFTEANRSGSVARCKDGSEIYQALCAERRRNGAVLLKGSHGSGMYKVVSRIKQESIARLN
ncbi:UDP-N-acetylmuramoyl-tripeptide--D-alanyl-D-alanine ligase [Azoarcus sp. PA01]|nr:UDP-N-acetylmuramoyl-tripeptide--D-alanyl-D-alanine ligase [Azoarcus sp. PA01]